VPPSFFLKVHMLARGFSFYFSDKSVFLRALVHDLLPPLNLPSPYCPSRHQSPPKDPSTHTFVHTPCGKSLVNMLSILIMRLPSTFSCAGHKEFDRKHRLCPFAVSCPTPCVPHPGVPLEEQRDTKSTWSGHITPLTLFPCHSLPVPLYRAQTIAFASPCRPPPVLPTPPNANNEMTPTHPLPASMLAGVADHHGDRFDMRQVPVKAPGPGQALVKIITSGVCHVSRRFGIRVERGRKRREFS